MLERSGAMARYSACWLVLAVLAIGPHVEAQRSGEDASVGDEPAALLRRGLALRREGRDAEALELFRQAHAAAPSGRTSAQVGLALQALGRWVAAERALREALATDDAWVARHREALSAALVEVASRLGDVEIECSVAGALVRVDGESVGFTPLPEPVRAPIGTVVVAIEAPGHYPVERRVRVSEVRAHEIFTLVPWPSSPEAAQNAESAPAPDPLPATSPPIAPDAPSVIQTLEPQSQPAVSRPWRDLGIATAVGAAIALTLGAAAWAVREEQIAIWNDDARCDALVGPSRDEECPGPASAWRVGETLAVTGAVAGGALLVGATVFFVLDATQRKDARDASDEP